MEGAELYIPLSPCGRGRGPPRQRWEGEGVGGAHHTSRTDPPSRHPAAGSAVLLPRCFHQCLIIGAQGIGMMDGADDFQCLGGLHHGQGLVLGRLEQRQGFFQAVAGEQALVVFVEGRA